MRTPLGLRLLLTVTAVAALVTLHAMPRRSGPPRLTRADSAQITALYENSTPPLPMYERPKWMRQLELAKVFAAAERYVAGDSVRIEQNVVDSIVDADGAGTYIRAILAEHDGKFQRWPARHGPIHVWIQSPTSDEIEVGFRAWNAANAGVSFEITDDSTQADVFVTWTSKLPSNDIGLTLRQTDRSGRVLYVWVMLLSTTNAAALQNVAVHEAGHALGLDHSPDPDDIMHAEANPMHILSEADKRTLRLLYQLPFSHY